MKKFVFVLVFYCFALLSAPAQETQSNDAEAAGIPDRLFAAMREKNPAAIRDLFTPEGQLVAIDQPRDGQGPAKTRVFTAEQFAKMISGGQGEYLEKMSHKDVKVDGDLATVAGRYTFHVGEKFSHCGRNAFHLVRTAGGWKVANAASTIEFRCEPDLKNVEVPAIEANPRDVATIDGVIKTFYEVISGGTGVARQWSRDRTLYIPGVRFVAMSEKDGSVIASVTDHHQYVNSSNELMVKEGFTERELHRVVRRFGNIAHVFSTYEYFTADKKQRGRGVNSIDLFWDGKRWWVSAVSWDEERPNNPIPPELTPKSKR